MRGMEFSRGEENFLIDYAAIKHRIRSFPFFFITVKITNRFCFRLSLSRSLGPCNIVIERSASAWKFLRVARHETQMEIC